MIAPKNKQDKVRCAIYTRKSTEEGLQQEFNTLDAQRESGEAYIGSQKHEGWECLPTRYDDGGFTGGNMDRPALKRLLADIEDGQIDVVVVYKVDRLSRSLLDFSRIMEVFDRNEVSFVSVTQQFSTTSSMGRLTLHILLSFAQFEREMISERTRDKMAAARRRGKWVGGQPILGYNVVNTKLVIDKPEADQVRQIFNLCRKHESLLATAKELNARGWSTKRWTTRNDKRRGGARFTKSNLHQLLTNPTYIGKVRYKDEVFDGEHAAIVDEATFDAVQDLLNRNGSNGGREVRNKHGATLSGVLRCSACECAMSHSFTTKGQRRYRYYVCTNAQKAGWDSCPAPSVPAAEIERFVVDEIRAIGQDPELVAATLAATREQIETAIDELTRERSALERQRRGDEAELGRLARSGLDDRSAEELADLQDRITRTERRLTELDEEIIELSETMVGEADVATALAEFDGVWAQLSPKEQARVIRLLIERIDHHGDEGKVTISFRPTGIRLLAEEVVA